MIFKIRTKIYFLLLSFVLITLDQFTKYLIFFNYKILANKDFLLFKLDLVKNYGAAFNILSGSRIFLSIVSFTFSIILINLILRKKSSNVIDLYSYSFLLGGTIGNGIDRIINGYVIDFININFINFPVFNIADISINIGFIIILLRILLKKEIIWITLDLSI